LVGSDHVTRNCWPPELRRGLMAFCQKHDLDKTYGVFVLVIKQLYNDGFISKEVYDFYVRKFSVPISSIPSEFNKAKPVTLSYLKQQQKKDEFTRYFQAILASEWQLHSSREWRLKVLEKAEKWKGEIEQAQLVLDLGAYLL